MVVVCYRPSSEEEVVVKTFLKQFREALGLDALVLMKDFSYTDICWESNTAVHKQSRRFLEYVKDNFLTQLLNMSTKSGALLDLHIRKSCFET